jgi:hypothetical protein
MSANDQPSKREGQWYPSRPVNGRAEGLDRCPRCDSPARGHRGPALRNGVADRCDHPWHDGPVKAVKAVKVKGAKGKRTVRAVGR